MIYLTSPLQANTSSDSTAQHGSCCTEVDILEANSQAMAYTLHPCTVPGQYRCTGTECGSSICDTGGCDFNPWRTGDQTFFGTGKTIDTSKKVTVITQFITSGNKADGDLIEVRRLWVQDGVVYKNSNAKHHGLTGNSLTDAFCKAESKLFGGDNTFKAHGGMSKIGDAIDDGMVLTFSLWSDATSHLLWLDSNNYPVDADPTKPGISRGPCSTDSGKPEDILKEQPNASVTFSNIKIGDIGSTYSS